MIVIVIGNNNPNISVIDSNSTVASIIYNINPNISVITIDSISVNPTVSASTNP